MTMHAELVEAIRGRKGSPSRFGYGIGTADRIVAKALGEISDGFCQRIAGVAGAFDRDAAIKEAMGRLVCCTPDAKVEQTATSASFKSLLPDGIEAPPHTLMVLRYTLTTARKDRDGDVLHPDGADIDPSGPMLWQHLANLPIGKMLQVVEKSPRRLREIGVLLDLNELTEDCAKLFEAGALRFSHGFQAIDWREMKAEPARPGKAHSPGKVGFEVLKFEVLERSAVSVPANSEAILELGSRGKGFSSEPMKAQVKSLMAGRPVQVPGAEVETPNNEKCGPCGIPYSVGPAVTTGKPLTPAQQSCLSSLMETAAKCRECASACAPLSDRMWNVIQACGTVAGACDVAGNMLAAGSVAGLSAVELVVGESLTVLSIHHLPICEETLAACQKCQAAIRASALVEVVPAMAAAGEIETKAKEKPETMKCPECDADIPLGSETCPECEAEIGEEEEEEPEEKATEPDDTKASKWPDPETIMVCPNAECGYRAPKRFWTPEKVAANGDKFTCPKCKADMKPEGEAGEETEEEVPAEKHLEGTHDQLTHGHGDGSASGTSPGGKESYNDRIEGTQKEADREVKRADKAVERVKSEIESLKKEMADSEAANAAAKAKMEEGFRKEFDKIDAVRNAAKAGLENGKKRGAELKALLKKRPRSAEDMERVKQIGEEQKAEFAAFQSLRKSTGDNETIETLLETEAELMSQAVAKLKSVADDCEKLSAKIAAAVKGKSGIWVTLDQMRTVCPESADAMKTKGLATINIETLEPDVLRKFLQSKAGRVLSGANVATLQECLDDLEELAGMQMPRAASALAGRIVQRLSALVEAAAPEKEEPEEEKTIGKLLAHATPAELARFQKSVQAILRVQELDSKGEKYRQLCSC